MSGRYSAAGARSDHGRRRLSSEDASSKPSKRRKIPHDSLEYEQQDPPGGRKNTDYTIGWICAIPIEMASALAMLDCTHEGLPIEASDTNAYNLGNIGPHNVVIACLGDYGTINAAHVAANMKRSFPSIRAYLMVGIGGGAPGSIDLRLGDVVVGRRVMQYEMGHVVEHGFLKRPTILNTPRSALSTAISKLRAIHESNPTRIPSLIEDMLIRHPGMTKYAYPADSPDRLFLASYQHDPATSSCETCDASQLVQRPPRPNRDPRIYYGAIASGNKVMKHGITRDKIAQDLDIMCFEMEAAGLTDHLPSLVVRGICDYSDSHKNKKWQKYAAAIAAAYAKELLMEVPWTRAEAALVATHSRVESDDRFWLRRRRKLMHALKFAQIASRESTIKSAHSATCDWLLEHVSYREWSDPKKYSQHRGFLWISGKPGSGKSTIMKFLTTLAKRNLYDDDVALASFFFNARGDHLEKSTEGMFRSILLQLLERFLDLQSVLDDTVLIPREHKGCPNLEILEILLRKAISLLDGRSFTCFVDALDECDEDQVRDMVEYFEELSQQVGNDAAQFRICFSSRHYPYVRLRHGFKLTLEDQKGHKDDLAKYVRSRLRAEPSPQTDELYDQILQKAAGVFMWVVLVVDILDKELQRGRVFAAKKRLQQIPEKLSDVFRDIIGRDDRDREDFLLCVQWILYSKRSLSPEEFFYAVCSSLSQDDLTEAMATPITPDTAHKFVISTSKGLAEVTKSGHPTVQFIHESVRDFLIKEGGVHELWPELSGNIHDTSHEKLKECCHVYLKFALCQGISPGQPTSKLDPVAHAIWQKTIQGHPFLEYSVDRILWHSNAAAKTISQNTFLNMFPLQDWIFLHNFYHWSELEPDQYTSKASLIYIFASENLPHLLCDRRHQHSCIDPFGEQFSYPFFAALINGHGDAVQAILGLGAYKYGENDVVDDLMSWTLICIDIRETPLTWAAQEGHVALAEFLIKSGADLHRCDATGRDPLHVAAINGHEGFVKLLLLHGADVHSREGSGYRAILEAAKNGHTSVVQSLIDGGIDLQSEHGPARRAMYEAARSGHTSVVRLLIGTGVDLDSLDGPGPTALFEASRKGHVATVKLLLEHGVAADAQRGRALSLAARNGHRTTVKVLIENGADAKSGRSLVVAAKNGHEAVVKTLLENGAEAEARGAISAAIRNGHTDIIELLTKHSAKIGDHSADCHDSASAPVNSNPRSLFRYFINLTDWF